MKKISIYSSLLAFMGCFAVQAQQTPLYSSNFFTPYFFNPAASGASGVTEATVLHRRQWTKLPDAPQTTAFGVNGALNDDKVGWSVYGFTDNTNILTNSGVYGSYAYHVKLTGKSKLSFGLSAGYLRNSINTEAMRLENNADPITFYNLENGGAFDGNFGVNLKIENFTIGASAVNLISSPINFSQSENITVSYGLIRHFMANTSYDFKFNNDKVVLSPYILLRVAEPNVPLQIDGGMMLNIAGIGYIGGAYRSDYGAVGNIGFHLNEYVTFGYSYEYSTNTFSSALGATNEIMLTYRFGNNKANERMENEIKKLKADQRKQRENFDGEWEARVEELKDDLRREMKTAMEAEAKKIAEANEAASGQQAGQRQGQQTGGQTGQGRQQQQRGAGQQQTAGQGTQTGTSGQQTGAGQQTQTRQATGSGAGVPASQVQPGSKGYYVVAGVFGSESNAQRQVQKVENQGFDAAYFRDPSNNMFYVYLFKYDSYRDANNAKNSNINGTYNGSLWVKVVE
ncbi:MAG: PorP/SprF family type IX secretion system membrane protein [Schleiferiaceae bacterium]|nr:PorP/SprF family type IX secretion system membrane protein [Schleiferiaceae bacterium]